MKALILTMPAGMQADPEALRREFGVRGLAYNWHPSQAALPGVLHLTCMHPEDLRAAGCVDFIERGWGAQPVAAPHRPRHPAYRAANCATTQSGRISLPFALHTWLLALMVGLLMGASHLLDGPTDTEAAQDTAASAQEAAEHQRRARVMQRLCGGADAVWQQLPDGSVQCRTKHNRNTVRLTAAAIEQEAQR